MYNLKYDSTKNYKHNWGMWELKPRYFNILLTQCGNLHLLYVFFCKVTKAIYSCHGNQIDGLSFSTKNYKHNWGMWELKPRYFNILLTQCGNLHLFCVFSCKVIYSCHGNQIDDVMLMSLYYNDITYMIVDYLLHFELLQAFNVLCISGKLSVLFFLLGHPVYIHIIYTSCNILLRFCHIHI